MSGHRWWRAGVVAAGALALLLSGCSDGGTDNGEVTVLELRTGDCFNGGDESRDVEDVDTVPCEEPHDSEVFAVVDHPGADGVPFPGDEAIKTFGASACLERFEGYVGAPHASAGLGIGTVGPRAESWVEADDRQIACVLTSGEPLTGSRRAEG